MRETIFRKNLFEECLTCTAAPQQGATIITLSLWPLFFSFTQVVLGIFCGALEANRNEEMMPKFW